MEDVDVEVRRIEIGKEVLVPFGGQCRRCSSIIRPPDSLYTIVSVGSISTSLKVLVRSPIQIGSGVLLL